MYLPIYSAKDNFSFYERKKISFNKTLSSTLLTFPRIYYKHLRSGRNNKVYIALRVAGGKISLPRIYLYRAVILCHCLDFPFHGTALSISQIVWKGFNKEGSVVSPLTMETFIK